MQSYLSISEANAEEQQQQQKSTNQINTTTNRIKRE